jgi:hypothetical protein
MLEIICLNDKWHETLGVILGIFGVHKTWSLVGIQFLVQRITSYRTPRALNDTTMLSRVRVEIMCQIALHMIASRILKFIA